MAATIGLMTFLVLVLAWLAAAGLATVLMSAVGRAGHWEDVQREYVRPVYDGGASRSSRARPRSRDRAEAMAASAA